MPLSVRVWDFLDRNYRTIAPDATIAEAMLEMSDAIHCGEDSRSLIVIDKQNKPLGVISMRNILDAFKKEFNLWLGLLGEKNWSDTLEKGLKSCNSKLVRDYMVKVPSLRMGDSLLHAYKILTEKNLEVRAVPVVEAGKVEGVVRIPELFEAFVEAYKKLA